MIRQVTFGFLISMMSSCIYSGSSDVIFEDQMYLNSQNGSTRLDKFTHCFLVKCSVEVVCRQPYLLSLSWLWNVNLYTAGNDTFQFSVHSSRMPELSIDGSTSDGTQELTASTGCSQFFYQCHPVLPSGEVFGLSLIHIWRCRRIERCRSRWSPYH